ncbi:MAG: FtsW/RodA/SpoVE family cell cycle protein [Bacteroidales bacterium]|nr:FtsW/RodA/SpoVE family cell cycle protein [Bacteroidales bacterium]MCF8352396.1 FtsW/RodA/SpoVE family cell cycle protein [Bacteroidales bacterium]MCF8377436.1 FtsW/RodA/SpoVE family cell cycle protein [Bacteroidales bacterium]MCF8401648.1 FtsW/RodA/SpoVE family cell cycle protein [Bacteroidales bacterium]
MTAIINKIRGDKVIWIVVILLSVFSLLAVYSSTGTLAYKYRAGNTEYYVIKHFMILLFGFVLMYLAHLIKYTYYSRIFQIALYIAVPLLILTLLIGLNLNEAKRALPLPFNLSFQTSDLAKLTLIMYLARLLTKKQDHIKDFKSAFVPIMIPVLIVCGLILPNNFSTAAMLFATSLVLMFIGRINMKYILYMIAIGVFVLGIFVIIAYNADENSDSRIWTWKNRIESFVNPAEEDSYQVEQSKIAIASGGIIGKLPGNSTQRNFLPHPYSDFIFAIIVEEYGLLGATFVVLLYLILFFRAVKIITKIPRTFGAFLVFGVAFSLVFQAMINMGVAVNLLPVTGQPLPFISMGGTSIWFTSISIGIILSVSKEVDKREEQIQQEAYVGT